MKKLFLIICAALLSASLFAGPNSFVKITNRDVGDSYYAYNTTSPNLDEHIQFTGSVSSDCVSIRVIWGHGSEEVINQYLLNGKKVPGEKVDDWTLSKYVKGSREFLFNVNGTLSNLDWGTNYYRVIAKFADGTYKTYTTVFYLHQGGMAEKGKPVIYLYPQKTQTVKVEVKPEGGLTVSDPDYKNGWKVKATPEGVITDLKTKKEYPYLFWESKDKDTEIDMSKGFVTPVKDLEKFFTEKLTALGLNEKEIADFNEFWIPSIEAEGKKYVFITFYDQARIDAEAPLTVKPAPDSVIRVYFDHKTLDKPVKVEPQELTANERKGFAVVEWGGRLYK